MEQRYQAIPNGQHFGIGRMSDALAELSGRDADQFSDIDLRDGIALPSMGNQQGWDDGQRQRQLDAEGGPPSRRGFDVDLAAESVEVGLHDIHADAPPRCAGY